MLPFLQTGIEAVASSFISVLLFSFSVPNTPMVLGLGFGPDEVCAGSLFWLDFEKTKLFSSIPLFNMELLSVNEGGFKMLLPGPLSWVSSNSTAVSVSKVP